MKLTTGLEKLKVLSFASVDRDRQKLLVDPTQVEKFVSQLGT